MTNGESGRWSARTLMRRFRMTVPRCDSDATARTRWMGVPITGRDLAVAATVALATYAMVVGIPARPRIVAARGAALLDFPAVAEQLLESAATTPGDDLATMEALRRLGTLYRIRGRDREALAYLTQARLLLERSLGPRHPKVALLLQDLAMLSVERGDPAGAAALQHRASIIQTAAYGPHDPRVLLSLEALADILRLDGRLDEALRTAHRVLALRRTTEAFRNVYVGRALGRIGGIHRERGEMNLAELYLDSALAQLSPAARGRNAGPMTRDETLAVGREAARVFTEAGLVRVQQERLGVARRLLMQSFDLYTGQIDEATRQAEVLSHVSATYRKEGDRDQALQHLRIGLRLAHELPRSPAVEARLRKEFAKLTAEADLVRSSDTASVTEARPASGSVHR